MFLQSLSHQIVLWVLIPIVCVNSFIWFQLDSLHSRSLSYLERDIAAKGHRIVNQFQMELNTIGQLALMTARDSEVIAAFTDRGTDRLYRIGNNLITSTLIDQVTFIDPQGIVVARGHQEYNFNDSLADSLLFQRAKAGEIFTGIAQTKDGLAFVSARPVLEFGAVLRGALIVARLITPGYLQHIGDNLGLEASISRQGRTGNFSPPQKDGIAFFTQQLPLHTFKQPSMTLVIKKNYRNELQALNSIRLRILVFSLAATLLAMGIVYCLVSYLLRPLRHLRTWLQAFKEGELGVEALNANIIRQNNKKNELGFIAHAALGTIQELEGARNELQCMHSELEVLVEERTQELLFKATELEEEIRDRELAETQVRGLKNHLQNIFDSMGCTLIGIDAAGVVNFVNAHAETFCGRTFTELCGESLVNVLAAYGLPGEEIYLRSQSGNEQWKSCRYVARHRGQQVYLDVTTYPFSYGGETGQIIRIDDVSRHVHLEQELFKNEKLRSVGLLAGGIAHDFNNFLSAILGNISLALADESLTERVGILLSDAEKASVAAKELTGQLLTFSKGGQPVMELQDLAKPVHEAAQLAVLDRAHFLVFEIEEDLWPVMIDRVQIERVVRNIVSNAVQVTTSGGQILITCANRATVEHHNPLQLPPGSYVRLSISDSGPGMDSEVLDQIFDPYFSTKSEGYGLGLAICHSIIEKHKGAIAVDSSPGKGTTFSIYLPAYPNKVRLPQAEQQVAQTAKCRRILVMDDDLMVQDMIVSMLEVLGHKVVCAQDGEEAIKKYQQALETSVPFDLVIMDLVIPCGMGGVEAAQEIHRLDEKARLIVSSGYSDDPVLAQYEDYGFCAALPKPYQFQELEQIIIQVIEEN